MPSLSVSEMGCVANGMRPDWDPKEMGSEEGYFANVAEGFCTEKSVPNGRRVPTFSDLNTSSFECSLVFSPL